ncbi:MAG: xanthine dehydrogenase large subunit, partial [Limisphaerales bacterium]
MSKTFNKTIGSVGSSNSGLSRGKKGANKSVESNYSRAHESASLHVSGEAIYIDDIPVDNRLLVGHIVWSKHANAKIRTIKTRAAKQLEGVHAVLCAKDIPGVNNMGPVVHDEPVLATGHVHCIGQAICLIAAETAEIARKAEALIEIEYEVLKPVLTIDAAREEGSLLQPERIIESGNALEALENAAHRIKGKLEIGGQEHWYLETQICLCLPGEDKEMTAWSSTQHPSETQTIISEVLGIPRHEVDVLVRRMGGAFGGKETQANHIAAWTALLANATRRPVKTRLFRDDDQKITGKRHPYKLEYEVGYDQQGKILAYQLDLHADGGMATDLTMAVLERAMMHAENSYFIPNTKIRGFAWKTNTPSNTAFRGFGGPQGMCGIELAIEKIAASLAKDPLEIRLLNFYKEGEETPYGQAVEHNRLQAIAKELISSSEYVKRKKELIKYNAKQAYLKRGIAISPVKFGISFTTSFLNQAGALLHIYRDGSILVNHGGTEMGQGLHTKIAQIAALELGVPALSVKVNATHTAKVPNTSATAASAGTDLNGMAV